MPISVCYAMIIFGPDFNLGGKLLASEAFMQLTVDSNTHYGCPVDILTPSSAMEQYLIISPLCLCGTTKGNEVDC